MLYDACGGCSDRLLLANAWPFSIAAALMLCVRSSRPMETELSHSRLTDRTTVATVASHSIVAPACDRFISKTGTR